VESPYTHTTWRVKDGHEDDFIARWQEWVDWSRRQGLSAAALLLRDVEDPHVFVSFGPWENLSAIRNWRGLAGYHERVALMREAVESFEPRTLGVVSRR
jgi:heme-degrading monooxygenase HmoA